MLAGEAEIEAVTALHKHFPEARVTLDPNGGWLPKDAIRLMRDMHGVAGIVPDGGFRDSPEIGSLAIHSYHQRPSAPTNLTIHQALDINVPIGCGDAPVWPGDVVVGDGEGVIIIPVGIADEIALEATEMTAFEDFVTAKVLEGRSILGLYPPTDPQS